MYVLSMVLSTGMYMTKSVVRVTVIGIRARVRVSVQVGGVRVPFRVGLILDWNHAAGQGAVHAPVTIKPEGVAAGNVVVVGVLHQGTLRTRPVHI